MLAATSHGVSSSTARESLGQHEQRSRESLEKAIGACSYSMMIKVHLPEILLQELFNQPASPECTLLDQVSDQPGRDAAHGIAAVERLVKTYKIYIVQHQLHL